MGITNIDSSRVLCLPPVSSYRSNQCGYASHLERNSQGVHTLLFPRRDEREGEKARAREPVEKGKRMTKEAVETGLLPCVKITIQRILLYRRLRDDPVSSVEREIDQCRSENDYCIMVLIAQSLNLETPSRLAYLA